MLPSGWEAVRRILAVRLDNIGDVVMLAPALRTLKRALPEASITLMASPAGSQAAPLLPWVDGVLVHRPVWQDVSGRMPLDPARELALVEAVRAGRYDAAVVFTSFSQSPYPPAYVCYLAGIPIRLGQSKEFGGGVLSHAVTPPPDGAHQVDRNVHLLESVGFRPAGRHLELRVPEDARQGAARLLRSAGVDPEEPYAVLAPGASCEARRYPPGRAGAVARALAAEAGLPVVLVGSERDAAAVEAAMAAALGRGRGPAGGRVVSLAGLTTVPELAAIVRGAALVIGNNSAPMHLADAFRRPLVVTYSGTDREEQWRPRTAPAALLRRPTPCSPCYRFTCPYGLACLDIPPAEVACAALGLLAQSAGERRRAGPTPAGSGGAT
ncbi:MAG TPA: glycosyltransferase family 9 protein [Dehalococcoidia bacterium]